MVDKIEHGLRPQVDGGEETCEGLAACPGLGLERDTADLSAEVVEALLPEWGPVLEVLEGHAAAADIRSGASSGGAATGLALYGLEVGGMHGVLHTRSSRTDPIRNETVLSKSRDDLMSAVGSRYSPASPCAQLDRIEGAAGPCVFIGKPCDVAAARAASVMRPKLKANLGLTMNVFCAGTPSTGGTLALLTELGVGADPQLERVTYRGDGWPGEAEVDGRNAQGTFSGHMSYAASWGILQKFRPWRCYVCADHTGEFADVSLGDPWYRDFSGEDPGRSLIVIRSDRGRRFVHAAIDAGYLVAHGVPSERLPDSQPSLRKAQASVFGRTTACRSLGVPAPTFKGFGTRSNWIRHLTLRQKAQSIFGTLRRVFTRGLYRRVS